LPGLLALLLCSSCKTKKLLTTKLKPIPAEELNIKNKNSELVCNWFAAKAKVLYQKDDSKLPFTMSYRIRKDSVIWISVLSPIGMEGARILITKNSIQVLDRLNKKCYQKDYKFAKKYIPLDLDFETIQSILLNKRISTETSQLSSFVKNDQYLLRTESNEMSYDLYINSKDFYTEKAEIKHKFLNYSATIDYQDHKEYVDFGFIPLTTIFSLKGSVPITLKISLAKITPNNPQRIPFKIPESYSIEK